MSALDQYIENMSSPEDALLHELERETYLRVLNARMISGHVQGKLLEMIVRMIRPQRVLEIGTFTGYSALAMAAGLPEGGVIDTCEVDDELEMFILDFFERSQYAERLNLHIGSALDTMQTLNQVYDLVFIDGDKREYTAYYNMLFDKGVRFGATGAAGVGIRIQKPESRFKYDITLGYQAYMMNPRPVYKEPYTFNTKDLNRKRLDQSVFIGIGITF